MRLAKGGRRVVVVERQARVGGSCTHVGTIPSKALRHSVGQLLAMRQSPLFGAMVHQVEVTFPKLLVAAAGVIDRQVGMRRDFYLRNHVSVHHGTARFASAHRVEVVGDDGSVSAFDADHVILATGSRPWRPPNVPFVHPRVYDSDTVLQMSNTCLLYTSDAADE